MLILAASQRHPRAKILYQKESRKEFNGGMKKENSDPLCVVTEWKNGKAQRNEFAACVAELEAELEAELKKNCGEPFGLILDEKSPIPGSSSDLHDVRNRSIPNFRSSPIFIPGSRNEVSILVYKEKSRRTNDWIVPVCNPHHSFLWHFMVPNPKISMC
uniref:Uncharacterized protein n=1 Tax=Salix viminalis TaxID=40686 RepID=A0A6N2L7T6_SALVM